MGESRLFQMPVEIAVSLTQILVFMSVASVDLSLFLGLGYEGGKWGKQWIERCSNKTG